MPELKGKKVTMKRGNTTISCWEHEVLNLKRDGWKVVNESAKSATKKADSAKGKT